METIKRNITYTEEINLVTEVCYKCGVPFAMPSNLKRRFVQSKESFYCPNGHGQAYLESESDRLKKELTTSKTEHENKIRELTDRMLDAMNEKSKLAKQLKRVHNGVCPCCKRSFSNLQKHMKTKHPNLITDASEK